MNFTIRMVVLVLICKNTESFRPKSRIIYQSSVSNQSFDHYRYLREKPQAYLRKLIFAQLQGYRERQKYKVFSGEMKNSTISAKFLCRS